MGGIGSLPGAVLGGVIIGCIQQHLRQPDRRRVDSRRSCSLYLVLIMVFKPQGLLGEQTREAG